MDKDQMDPISLQQSLEGIDYPASKRELIEQANENKAGERVIDFLEKIPEKDYASSADVTRQMPMDSSRKSM